MNLFFAVPSLAWHQIYLYFSWQSECVIYIESQEESEEDITFQRVALRNNTGIVIAGCANKSHVVFDLCDIRGNRQKDPGKELIWFSNTDYEQLSLWQTVGK